MRFFSFLLAPSKWNGLLGPAYFRISYGSERACVLIPSTAFRTIKEWYLPRVPNSPGGHPLWVNGGEGVVKMRGLPLQWALRAGPDGFRLSFWNLPPTSAECSHRKVPLNISMVSLAWMSFIEDTVYSSQKTLFFRIFRTNFVLVLIPRIDIHLLNHNAIIPYGILFSWKKS